jgi:MinD-like ATPase involved in chromosome partitioning or flagellar assembly
MFLNYSELKSLLEKLKERYEIVLLDTPPGVGYSMMTAARSSKRL